MKLRMVGSSHHDSTIESLERLAFSPDQLDDALAEFHRRFPEAEAVLLSTCNRSELYVGAGDPGVCPSREVIVEFLAACRGLDPATIGPGLKELEDEDAVSHLFTVVASLDSMVVGEAQILSQVKLAYQRADAADCAGPNTHAAFQAALHVAKRVATETALHQRRVSIPSVAVADFAKQIFERFDNKCVLVIGAGEMGEETLQYLIDEGAKDITIINRSFDRAEQLAKRCGGRPQPWDRIDQLLTEADLIVATTGAEQPIVTLDRYRKIERDRYQRPLFILDLALPRDFDPAIGRCLGVYLYSIGDLEQVCEANRAARQEHWPRAETIVVEETARFMADRQHHATGSTIKRLRDRTDELKEAELARLLNKLGEVDDHTRDEIVCSFDRLVNKLLHPPLESLRDDASRGEPHGLLNALKTLFQLKD